MLRSFHELCPRDADHRDAHARAWHEQTLRTIGDMDVFITDLLRALGERGFSIHDLFSIRLALEEAIVNAIIHGHHGDPSKLVHLRYQLNDACLLAEVADEGAGFLPDLVPDPLAPENLEREGGRGLFLMRSYMTWVRYNDAGNCVTLCKERSVE
jgi:serine/threonine-protein kinase RsbW